MYIHKTKDGDRILVSDMEDTHLKNTIELLIKNIRKCFDMINSTRENNINSIVSNIQIPNKERLEELIRERTNMLKEYIFEASIRGIDFSEHLQKCFDRNTKTNITGILEYDEFDDSYNYYLN